MNLQRRNCEPSVPNTVTIRYIDGEVTYVLASAVVTLACRRRFGDDKTTVIDPEFLRTSMPGELPVYLHWIENFWDGPYTVKDNGDETYSYTCPYTKNTDIFS